MRTGYGFLHNPAPDSLRFCSLNNESTCASGTFFCNTKWFKGRPVPWHSWTAKLCHPVS